MDTGVDRGIRLPLVDQVDRFGLICLNGGANLVGTLVPPRDRNDDDDEEEEEDDDHEADEDREPAVIREPDEDE